MPNRRVFDHLGNFNFKIEIEGVTQGAFRNVEGFDSETEVIPVDDNLALDGWNTQRPGRTKYANLTLKRGYVHNQELWNWRKNVVEGVVERRNGSVILCGDDGNEIMRYNFFEAWPTKWKSVTMDGKGTDALVEELELTVERLEPG